MSLPLTRPLDEPEGRPLPIGERGGRWLGLALVLIGLALAAPAQAGDAKAGRQKALQCQTCHGLDGQSKLPEAPNLAGQIEGYLVKSLTEYKTGARQNEMMSVVAPTLSDDDIADLAAYYASIEVTVKPPG